MGNACCAPSNSEKHADSQLKMKVRTQSSKPIGWQVVDQEEEE